MEGEKNSTKKRATGEDMNTGEKAFEIENFHSRNDRHHRSSEGEVKLHLHSMGSPEIHYEDDYYDPHENHRSKIGTFCETTTIAPPEVEIIEVGEWPGMPKEGHLGGKDTTQVQI